MNKLYFLRVHFLDIVTCQRVSFEFIVWGRVFCSGFLITCLGVFFMVSRVEACIRWVVFGVFR